MDRGRLLELLDAYLEQRLSETDRAALNAVLVSSPEARRLFWDYAYQHTLLCDLLAEGRGLRLAAEENGLARPPRPHRARWAPWLGVSVAALLLVALYWLFRPTPPPGSKPEPALARLGEVQGEVTVGADLDHAPAREGQVIRPGHEIRTGAGSAVVTYDGDGSRIELAPGTAIRLLLREGDRIARAARHIFLVKGVVNATVSAHSDGNPMVVSTPQADLLAPNGRFSSAAVLGETRIEMEEGKAVLTPRGEARGVEIQTGAYAVTADDFDMEVFKPAPMLPASTTPAAVFEDFAGPILDLAAVRNGQTLAIACSNGAVKFWDVQSRKVRGVLHSEHKRALALSAVRNGQYLAVGYEPQDRTSTAGCVVVWDVERQRPVTSLDIPRRVHALDFTPDGLSLVLASNSGGFRGTVVWDLHDRRPRFQLGERFDAVRTLAVSPDGQTVASGHRDGKVRIWDVNTGRPVAVLEGHTREVQALAFQPGGAVLASGSRDGSVRLWSMSTHEPLRRLVGKVGEARCLTFSPDGQTLATGHAGVALLWNVATGEQRSMLKAHKFAITALVYLPDGKTLATAGWDRAVKLWVLQPARFD